MAWSDRGRVAVICAPPNGSNPGMTSVDLAFADVARTAGLTDVTYWRLWDFSEWREFRGDAELVPAGSYRDDDTGLVYQSLRGRWDEALSAEHVVFWGDFMHMAVYQQQTVDVLARRIGLCSREEAEELVARSLLLRGVDEDALGRVLSYGSTLGMNTPNDYRSVYGRDLERFARGVRGIWCRDPYSAQVVRGLRGPDRGSAQALDAAFLLHDGVQLGGGGLGVFIGRSDANPMTVGTFGRRLSRRLDLTPRWIPWGEAPAFWPVDAGRRFRTAWPALELEQKAPSSADLLRTRYATLRGIPKTASARPPVKDLIHGLGDYDVILTDTYHLAINAWAQGVPTICLVDHGGKAWNVNSGEPNMRRDKRVDLYSQLDALGLVVDLTSLGRGTATEVERVAELANDEGFLTVVRERIATQRGHSMDAIVSALRSAAPRARKTTRTLRLAG